MNIDAIIYCFDRLHNNCIHCPHFSKHSGSFLGCQIQRETEAREIVKRYKKIEEIAEKYNLQILPKEGMNGFQREILEVINE